MTFSQQKECTHCSFEKLKALCTELTDNLTQAKNK